MDDPQLSPAPLVSIITPMFNAEQFISQTIESVQKQTLTNWEMLIVDDCSTDQSREIVREICKNDSRICLIERTKNAGGPAAPRNEAMRQARGKYFAFLDADDLWLPEKLEKQTSFMEQDRELFLSYTMMTTTEQHGDFQQSSNHYRPLDNETIFKQLLLRGNMVPILTVMIKNQNDLGLYFDESPGIVSCEDLDFWLQLAYAEKKFAFLDATLSTYRIHNANISSGMINSIQTNLFLMRKWRSKISLWFAVKVYALLFWRRGMLLLLRDVIPTSLWQTAREKLGIIKKI
ncbi:MAG: glycosyltransferase family 2 protein [Magnetococcales bacterium]|nr:glycosyltransferase family 2 protein [Magnetococcales bacterium]